MEIYKSEYMRINFDHDKALMTFTWDSRSEFLDDEQFKKEIEECKKHISEHELRYIIVNNRNFHFPITPELQNWMNESLAPAYEKSGVEKFAIIESEDLISQLGTEQTVEADEDRKHEIQFFKSEREAYGWFNK